PHDSPPIRALVRLLFTLIRRPPAATIFPYTTLFRSEEAQAVAKANEALEEAKAAAKAAIEEVPEARRGELSKTAEEVEALPGGQGPTVNDKNSNGVLDTTEANIDRLLAEAKQKAQEAKAEETKVGKNGVVTAEEKAQLDQAIKDAQDAKDAVDAEIAKLPKGSYRTTQEGESANI